MKIHKKNIARKNPDKKTVVSRNFSGYSQIYESIEEFKKQMIEQGRTCHDTFEY